MLFTAGLPPTITVATPGAQGPAITGVHGCGVNTPHAAAVAALTAGFANDVHMAKGMTFTIGTLSIIFATGAPHITLLAGNTVSADGAVPKLHINCVPDVTKIDTSDLLPLMME